MKANRKPWGYEYLIYQNDEVAIWHLFINKWDSTSMHCHPSKKTGLLVLCGGAKISFLNGHQKVFAGEKVMIRHGVFHQTMNMTSEILQLFEIETPVNKADIIRLEDCYGRAGKPYSEEHDLEVETKELTKLPQRIGDCTNFIKNISDFDDIDECDLIMIVKGGISFKEFKVAGPGDILDRDTFMSLANKFTLEKECLAVLIMSCLNQTY